jgi:hypothetical protein
MKNGRATIVIPGLTRDLPSFFPDAAQKGGSRVKPGMTIRNK